MLRLKIGRTGAGNSKIALPRMAQLDHFPGWAARRTEKLNAVTSFILWQSLLIIYHLFKMMTENDPIRTQCIPDLREISCYKDYLDDPLEEDIHMPVPKLIHRYPDRCLAIVTEICPTYCRHCNRKRFWSQSAYVSLKITATKNYPLHF